MSIRSWEIQYGIWIIIQYLVLIFLSEIDQHPAWK